jgi:hypothetical protein
MLLEVTAPTNDEAVTVAQAAGYVIDESYNPCPMPEGTWILRGERGLQVAASDRIKEWGDAAIASFLRPE